VKQIAQGLIRITPNTLVDRINRKFVRLRDPHRASLHTTRAPYAADLGRWHLRDMNGNVSLRGVDIEKLGRELGCLQPFETVLP
jgi:hypothetical protein